MGELPHRLLEEALKLPPDERAALADSLLRSLESSVDPVVDSAWRAEIARRVADLDAGAPTIPWTQARAEIMRA
jgi:putative addiction module component (TIGR02574 family)